MKTWFCVAAMLAALAAPVWAQPQTAPDAGKPFTLEDYEASTPRFGVPFHTRYPASIYTGFAMRVDDPNRIHFRAGRGNQVRLTAVIDEYSLLTYLYSLRKRYDAYAQAQAKGLFEMQATANLDAFRQVVDSPAYEIRGVLADFEAGKLSRPAFYAKSLEVLTRLNPGRVRTIDIDLTQAFTAWRAQARAFEDVENLDDAIVLTNAMLFGRVDAVFLDEARRSALAELVTKARDESVTDAAFALAALPFFESATHGRYAFQTVADGAFVPAIRCETAASCRLRYPEFTAIYPNGSVIASVTDRDGNTVNLIRNNGLMTFITRRYHDVDHIRSEGYYGYAPKMDWQAIGNGVHNPAVSHHLPGMKHLYAQLEIPDDYQFLWVPSRGPVSSGCVRVSQGHLWEVRHIFPADTEAMNRVKYFGNHSADYDVFDIDADGTAEVIGSDYIIAYSLRGASGDAKRRGKGFSMEGVEKQEFYELLYGKKGPQFEREGDTYWFPKPYVSYFRREQAGEKEGRVFSRPLEGRFVLYEEPYERDKVQVYHLNTKFRGQLDIRDNTKSTGKQMVRIFGRTTGCGPFAKEWDACYEPAFDEEFAELLGKL